MLPAAPPSAAAARHRVDEWMAAEGASAAVREPVVLVTSELMSNAIRASETGDEMIRLDLSVTDGGWRISVADHGPGFLRSRHARHGGELAEGGRGLRVIDHLAGPISVRRERTGWNVVSAVVPFPLDAGAERGDIRPGGSDR